MHAIKNSDFARLILGAGALAALVALLSHAAAAQDKAAGGTYVMKISTPTINAPLGPVAQLAEQQTLNLRVVGSIPTRLTRNPNKTNQSPN